MNTFLPFILALTVGADLVEPKGLYYSSGTLQPDVQLLYNFYVGKDKPVKLEAKGDGHGDLDCYLLQYNSNAHGWAIAARDESNMDQCSVIFTPVQAQPMRAWVVNHGVHPTKYTVVVKQ